MSLDTPERRELLALARASIDSALSPGRANNNLIPFAAPSLPPALSGAPLLVRHLASK